MQDAQGARGDGRRARSAARSLRRVGAGGARRARRRSAAISRRARALALRGGELAAYHGVEHKSIAAYETDGDAADAAKEHDRCGSHLVAPMLAANLAGTALLRRVTSTPSPVAQGAVALASLGVAVEVFAWSERNQDTAAASCCAGPATSSSGSLGTREPTEDQLEVGRAALEEIVRAERSTS